MENNKALEQSINVIKSGILCGGRSYLSGSFNAYLRLVGIRHIIAAPYHPETGGKIERYHHTMRGSINLIPYEMPSELEEAIRVFVEHYNYRRYHEGNGNVTPYDVYTVHGATRC